MILNAIWVAFILIGFVVALFRLAQGELDIFTKVLTGLFDTAKTGFDISLGLVGVMSLWPVSYTHLPAQPGARDAAQGSDARRHRGLHDGPLW